MRRINAVMIGLVVPVVALAAACSKDPPPPTQPIAGQPCQPGQPCQNAPMPGQTAPMPTQTTATGPVPGQLSTPGPTALPCQSDSQCLTHKCNTQYQKCAFPCASDFDCIQGSACMGAGGALATCFPKTQ